MEATTIASYSFTFNPLVFLAIAAIMFSKSFRNFVEDWGFVFMILSIHFYGFVGWLLLWAFYEYVVFLVDDNKDNKKDDKPKKKTKKKTKKSYEIDNDDYFEKLEKIREEEKRKQSEIKPKKKYI
jgi:Ca2+/Na+ antiporter